MSTLQHVHVPTSTGGASRAGAGMAVASMLCVQARHRRLHRAVRPHRARGRRVAAARLGRRGAAAGRPAAPVRLHPVGAAGLRRARRRDGRADPAVHGRRRPAAARHGERPRVPRPAGRRGGSRPRHRQALGRVGRRRCRAADPAVVRCGRPGRRRLRARRRGLLGGVRAADPARRRPGQRREGPRGVDAGRGPGGHRRRRAVRRAAPHPAPARRGPRPGAAAAGRAVHPRACWRCAG
nr:hypothetical protein [Angustibacter aerolatus]